MKKVDQTLIIVCICFHFKLALSYLIHFQNRHMTSELCRKEALEKNKKKKKIDEYHERTNLSVGT